MKIPNDCISFADIKNYFLFSDHSSGKRFRQNDDVPIVNLQLFFRRNPPDPWSMKKKMNVQSKTKVSEERNLRMLFSKFFLVLNKKKTFMHQHIKRHNNQKMLDQHFNGKINKKFRL